jgi:hypothetical protein
VGILVQPKEAKIIGSFKPGSFRCAPDQARQLSISEALRVIKASSSRRVRETYPSSLSGSAWQAGYGAFAVSHSHREKVRAYLSRQAEHYRKVTFQEEFLAFLRRHGITYDERYLWD